jgi:hypothetical protein
MRGADAAALRVGVGSSVQLPLYDNAKSLILATGVPFAVVTRTVCEHQH